MEEDKDNNRILFSPVEEEKEEEEEFSEDEEKGRSNTSSESGEWPNTAVEQNGLKLSRTTSKVEI